MKINLGQKLKLRFENGEYFGPFVVDAFCHHVQEDRYTYSLIEEGKVQPSFWFDSDEVSSYD